jgi:hypothetical protein
MVEGSVTYGDVETWPDPKLVAGHNRTREAGVQGRSENRTTREN